jgi:SAM-dependent methyltransferase
MKGYRPDLARVHDLGFASFSLGAAPFLLRTLREHGIRRGLVIDLGCGSGQWAEKLAKAGYDVLGIDASKTMVALAAKRVPDGRFVRASYLDAKLPPCVAVTALGEIFNYAFDPRAGTRGLARILANAHRALVPGGLLVFDFATPGRGAGAPVRHRSGEGWEIVSETSEDERTKTLTRSITTFLRAGTLYRRSVEVHRLRLYDPADVRAALRRAGFRARLLRGYGAERFPKAYAGFVARKPS